MPPANFVKYLLHGFLVAFSSFLLFTDRNVWTLNGRIYYLVEGSTKPQIYRNGVKVACLSYGKNCGMNSFSEFVFPLLLFFRGNYHRKQFFISKFMILFPCNGIAPLLFCFDLNSTKILSTYFFLLMQLYRILKTFYFTFDFK